MVTPLSHRRQKKQKSALLLTQATENSMLQATAYRQPVYHNSALAAGQGVPGAGSAPAHPATLPARRGARDLARSEPRDGSKVRIHYAVSSQWSGGFGATVTITNNGSTAIHGWTLAFSLTAGQQITQCWNGVCTQRGSQVTLSHLVDNGTIEPGASVGPGFNGSWSGSNPHPTAFTLNGRAATVVSFSLPSNRAEERL